MKRDDKELLIAFLCASIPYHLKVHYRGNEPVDLTDYVRSVRFVDCMPYLRPLSSMTDEEKKEAEIKDFAHRICMNREAANAFHTTMECLWIGRIEENGL